ncbi:L,D-transpeptidase family protein [Ferrimonas gelatinilytica]|uniref:L,D-transpeptidase family protein n=1 Tax=Ferrimonas gelatinilytica TaxID=1255257 RepID=A0ABP9SEM6_9GAMM
MKRYLWLWLQSLILFLLLLGQVLAAEPLWFAGKSPRSAARELEAQLTTVVAAQIDPRFEALRRALVEESELQDIETRSRLYSDAYQLLAAFWQELYRRPAGKLDLNEPFLLVPDDSLLPRLTEAARDARLMEAVLQLEPLFDDYLLTRNWIRHYLSLPAPPTLKGPLRLIAPGEWADEVVLIRQRLVDLNLMPPNDGGQWMDSALVARIQDFQSQHGLAADGVVGPSTRYWLYLSGRERARLLARSLLRQVHDHHFFARDHFRVNIPGFQAVWVEGQQIRFRSKVVVGRLQRQTPTMHSALKYVVINPRWNVPRSILRRDILPKIASDGGFVARHGYEVVGAEGQVLALTEEQIQSAAQQGFPYRLRQKPGPGNALGRYKFYLDNARAIYLHDTPESHLFRYRQRAFSSGCVRLDQAEELAYQLLHRNRTSASQIARWQSRREPKWVEITEPVPTYLVYWTAWIEGGQPQFRRDIYGWERPTSEVTTVRQSHR